VRPTCPRPFAGLVVCLTDSPLEASNQQIGALSHALAEAGGLDAARRMMDPYSWGPGTGCPPAVTARSLSMSCLLKCHHRPLCLRTPATVLEEDGACNNITTPSSSLFQRAGP
jgi:hypothetical protein